MAETADPLAALGAKDIPSRAAGARDLGQTGEPAQVARLLEMAKKDPSPGVRLACAAAAADILSRWRMPPKLATIPTEEREGWLQQVAGADPGVNTGLFQVCAVIGIPGGVSRIVVGLRDPRADVRTGATVGLHRLCSSAAANGDAALEATVVALLGEPRIRIETRAEIARICALVGYGTALERVRAFAATAERTVQTITAEALQRLEWPAPLEGVWVDLGLDAGEVNPAAEPRAYAALHDASGRIVADAKGARKENLARTPRRMWLRKPGATAIGAAVQMGASTFYPADGDEIGAFGDRLLAAEAWALLDAIDPLLPATATSVRLRGVVRLRTGDAAGALEALTAAVEMKKVPADAWWWLAEALHQLGRDDDARPHLEKYVAKAPKRAPHMAEAKKRLE